MEALSLYLQGLNYGIDNERKAITKFATSLASSVDPLHTLGWSKEVFDSAARLHVYTSVYALGTDGLDKGKPASDIVAAMKRVAVNGVMSAAREVGNSSMSTRRVETESTATAWARILDELNNTF